MAHFFNSMPWFLSAMLIVGCYIGVSLLILWFVRILFHNKQTEAFHVAATVGFANLGVLYAVLIAFVFVEVQARHNELRSLIDNEAATVNDLYRDAEVLAPEADNQLRAKLIDYARQVVELEWPAMKETQKLVDFQGSSSLHGGAMPALWRAYYDIIPKTERESIWLRASVQNLDELSTLRMNRWIQSQESLNTMMWTLLLGGAVLTTVFFSVFHVENFWMHAVISGLLNGIIAFILFLLFSFDNPFIGGAEIEPTPFLALLRLFK